MIVSLEKLSLTLGGRPVIRDISLAFPSGEISVIIGRNGSGKSTLLKLAAGLLHPSSGTVAYDGADIRRTSAGALARRRAILLQNPSAPGTMTVGELLHLARFSFDSGRQADETAIRRALDDTNCADLLPRTIGTLSGGEARKVFLSLALAQDPELLLLDEPEAGLDADFRTAFPKLLTRLRTERRLTVIMVMHDLDLALQCAHLIVGLNDGELRFLAPVNAPGFPRELTNFTENKYDFFPDPDHFLRALPRFDRS